MTDPIKVLAEKPVTKLVLSERLLGRRVSMPVYAEGELGQASLDLAADTFWSLFKRDPEFVETPGREGNKAILSWAMDNPGTQKARQTVIGNLPAAVQAAALMHVHLMSDEVAAEVLKKQEETAAAEAEAQAAAAAEEAAQQAAAAYGQAEAQAAAAAEEAAAQGNGKAAAAARKQAGQASGMKAQAQQAAAAAAVAKAEAQAQQAAAAAELAELADKLAKDKVSRASLQAAAANAAAEAEDLTNQLESWGLDPANPSTLDIAAALTYANQHTSKIAEIARVMGRAKKIALTQRQGERTEKGHTPTGGIITQDLNALFPEELARLSDFAPAASRALAWSDYLQGGMLGWDKKDVAKEEGNFYAVVDESGSMSWSGGFREIAAKGVSLGMAAAAKQDARRYRLGAFSAGEPVREVDSDAPFQDVIAWAEEFQDGGTDYDLALTWLLDQAEADQDPKADLVIISDEDGGRLSPEVVHRLNATRQRKGCRLFYIAIGRPNRTLADLADTVIVTEARDPDAIANALAEGMAQGK